MHVCAVIPSGRADVYNLTVEDVPEFFANRILVHNCYDALGYGLTNVRPPTPRPVVVQVVDRVLHRARGSAGLGSRDL